MKITFHVLGSECLVGSFYLSHTCLFLAAVGSVYVFRLGLDLCDMFHCGDVSPGGGGKWSEDCNSVSLRDAWCCPHQSIALPSVGKCKPDLGSPGLRLV